MIGPKPESITIDPLTPEKNQTQTVIVAIKDPVESAVVELTTDNQKTQHDLKNNNGNWEGVWTVDDNYDNTNAMRLILKNKSYTYDQTLYFR
ncbi:hypothetical protein A3A79_01845 [Candidatus Gottesmanbacteria bacterium RIFCSPLOWO2_01_FULL_43_11b]|uniref:Uncharacterized protein n=1 Tax=Candidatus Gottesmanbacteria bacterium RIFCSPLOWO2_01_FULL_43_11b TaxID=1798392 RepID=A0A1F6AHQ5_9BACT|nr:MAG: hypothetical protein A3A79_01845 [Candidatus Gottesmanbacteria bacterium RIFCSPLOWO2_01_FULL_43_11b]